MQRDLNVEVLQVPLRLLLLLALLLAHPLSVQCVVLLDSTWLHRLLQHRVVLLRLSALIVLLLLRLRLLRLLLPLVELLGLLELRGTFGTVG